MLHEIFLWNCPTTLQWKLKWFLSFCIRKYDIGWTIPVRVKSNISLKQLIWHPYNYSQNYQKSIPIILCFICNWGYVGTSLIKQPMWGNFLKTHFAISLEFFSKTLFPKCEFTNSGFDLSLIVVYMLVYTVFDNIQNKCKL